MNYVCVCQPNNKTATSVQIIKDQSTLKFANIQSYKTFSPDLMYVSLPQEKRKIMFKDKKGPIFNFGLKVGRIGNILLDLTVVSLIYNF